MSSILLQICGKMGRKWEILGEKLTNPAENGGIVGFSWGLR
jgi:hypothetical protein